MRPSSGLAKIVRFNWPWYAVAGLALCAGALGLRVFALPDPYPTLIAVALSVAAFWLVMSLAVSAYVYDHSGVARGDWMRGIDAEAVRRAAVFHAGQDEATAVAIHALPKADVRTFDFFDAARNGTPSLERARALATTRAESIAPDELPLRNASLDLGLVVFAAHEIRDDEQRASLFRELARVLAQNGRLVVVEHLRDAWNFLAYGPGAFHFLSRATWLRSFRAGGLRLVRESTCTPFVRVFELGVTR